ncbi:rod shape-determining protein MreC [Candidatus Anaplasma sp. TIGMIC]|uniref:rod shape-determining protein MreC n=1 Tax=Candidatus Anaplasma sp. TIGMIC TaxID=3020713 RepID=UPI00232C13E3|nr:rod shape-determining protein MreC [Candidatus Anaplasma sp. TIGMIC]MDB1135664.1 rod shape-determining protein MreC [Candidatus Anaplasma sp. TIGMIC]
MVKYVNIKPEFGVLYCLRKGFSKMVRSRVLMCVFAAIALNYFFTWQGNSVLSVMRTKISDGSVSAAKRVQATVEKALCHPRKGVECAVCADDARGDCSVQMKVLAAENSDLKRLLHFLSYHGGVSYVSAQAIFAHDGVSEKVFLGLGSRDGVKIGQAVVNGSGLVGKVADVNERSSRIILVTDKDFRIPVTVVESGVSAVLSGTGKSSVLTDLSTDGADIVDGSLVITAESSEGFPSGIYVGSVVKSRKKVFTVSGNGRLGIVSVLEVHYGD